MAKENYTTIDKLAVIIGKPAAKDSRRERQFKLQIHQNRGRGQNTTREIIRRDIGQIINQIVEIEDNSGKTEEDTDLSKVIGEIISGKIQSIMADKTGEENIEISVIGMIFMTEVGIGLEKGCFPEIMAVIELGVQAIVDQGQDIEQVQTGRE